MDLGLAGRTVLITGGSKGIGLACAHGFAAEGCDVHLVARTGADLERARSDISGRHQVQVTTSALDLSDSANVDRLVETAGDIDILVNNAGAIPAGSIDDVDESRWREAWDLKIYGYINMTRAFLARMKARGAGVIINDIGTGGEKLDFDYIAGAAGNASMMAFTRAIGSRSIYSGVRVVGVNPGPVETDRTFAGENERCKASDLPAQLNVSFQSMPPSTTISQRADISSQPSNTDTVVIKLSRHGAPPPTLLPDRLFRWASCVTQPSL